MTHQTDLPILVTGGNGKTGRRVAQRLQDAGHKVRIGSRSADPAFDWTDRGSWGPALSGVGAVYVAYHPDIAAPGALPVVRDFFNAAVQAGVTKIVLLSGRGEPEAQDAERALQALDVDWTILRSSWFSQNFSESYFLDSILAGEVALPARPIPEPFVDVEDIADIAFAALTGPGHSRELYEITGPRALTFAEAVGIIAGAARRDIRFVQVAPDDFRAALVGQGAPDEVADLVLYLFNTVLDGRNTPLGDGVQRALGRPPRDFSDYAARIAATGVWSAGSSAPEA